MRLPAFEKNILIYRALQMALFLFYAEDIKRQLIGSVGRCVAKETKKSLKGGKLLKAIFQRLVSERTLTKAESTELQELIEHRNQIAHHIHRLTGDIEIPGSKHNFQRYIKLHYDYDALKRVKKWRDNLWRRLRTKYVLVLSIEPLLFEAAEHAYNGELKSLKQRINRQYESRRKKLIENAKPSITDDR
jgi:hypothetical protein